MCFSERYTFSRGRSSAPASFRRMRLWTRCRMSFLEIRATAMLLRPRCLAGLLLQSLAHVADALLLFELDSGGQRGQQRALRPLHADAFGHDVDIHALGHHDRFVSYPRHGSLSLRNYQISHRISPPTFSLRAARPVISPFGVVK